MPRSHMHLTWHHVNVLALTALAIAIAIWLVAGMKLVHRTSEKRCRPCSAKCKFWLRRKLTLCGHCKLSSCSLANIKHR